MAGEESDDLDEGPEDVGISEDEVTGLGSNQTHPRGVIRIDYPGDGRYSAVLVAPNMIVTAAHCVSHLPGTVHS